MRIVVFSPHRDDAAFSLGLAIADWLSAGHTVEVINCFTRSAYAPFAETELLHTNDLPAHITALRLREDRQWQRQYGKESAQHPKFNVDLNLKDAPLRLRCSIDHVCDPAAIPIDPEEKAFVKIRKTVAQIISHADSLSTTKAGTPGSNASSAGSVAFVLPLAIGEHIDHRVTREAACNAIIAENAASFPCAFYEDLPYAARPGSAAALPQAAQRLGQHLHTILEPAFAATATKAVSDVQAAVARKRELALCYDSQIDDAVAEQIADFSVQYDGRERLWTNEAFRIAGLAFAQTQNETRSKLQSEPDSDVVSR